MKRYVWVLETLPPRHKRWQVCYAHTTRRNVTIRWKDFVTLGLDSRWRIRKYVPEGE